MPPEYADVRSLIDEGHFGEAETRARQLLTDVERTYGSHSIQTAEVVDLLMEALGRLGKATDPQTRVLGERAVAIKERVFGTEHPDVALSLNNLGILYYNAREFAQTRSLFQRALAIRESALGPDHLDVADSLYWLGALLEETGDYTEARQVLERALAIRETLLGPEHSDVASSLNSLALVQYQMAHYDLAKRLYERALAMREKLEGPDDPDVAAVLNNLGMVLEETGDYSGAKRVLERALAIHENARGPNDPFVASTTANLAILHQLLGDYAVSRKLYERALAVYEKTLGPEHPWVAWAQESFADLLRDAGEEEAARALLERALASREKVLGPDHPGLARNLGSLAGLLAEAGETGRARSLYERALAILEKAHGPHYPEAAPILRGFARLLRDRNDYARARPLYERALTIQEKAFGSSHPGMARGLNDLAEMLLEAGETAEALEFALRAQSIGTEHLRLTTRALAERQALTYASKGVPGFDVALSVTSRGLNPSLAADVWDAVIRSRALVFDEIAARNREATEISRLVRELVSARERLANLVVRGAGGESPQRYRRLLDKTRRQKEQAEQALAERSLAFRHELRRNEIGLVEVVQSLPHGSALVAFVRYNHHRSPKQAKQAQLSGITGPVPSYLAFVLQGGKTEPGVALIGNAGEIDLLVEQWREEAAHGVMKPRRSPEEAEAAYRSEGQTLRQKAWDPIANRLDGAQRVFVVADGALHLVNFYALPVGEREYVLEAGPLIHYLSAERDLVVAAPERSKGEGLLVLGNPAFDEPSFFATLAPERTRTEASSALNVAAVRPYRGERSACGDFQSIRFEPLPASARETERIAALWKSRIGGLEGGSGREGSSGLRETPGGVLHLTGAQASEAAFKKNAPGRRVLHLATHGFFLGGLCPSVLDAPRGIGRITPAREDQPLPLAGENPLLLAGLALAGANHRKAAGPGEEDGILTAEEIAAMDLDGVEWAVLSACDTGVGEVKAGEGVFGLRRAFQIAGAETVIMSLWPVEDEQARQWMEVLYDNRILKNLGTAEAVRAASLRILRQQRLTHRSGHPFYWASFVAAGS